MTWGTFGLLIFSTSILREEITRTDSRNKCQSITRTGVIIFYRHNKRDDNLVVNCINCKKNTT